MNVYFIFTDLKGYSKFSEEDTIKFQSKVCKELAEHIEEFINPSNHVAFNTWGDAVYAVFEDGSKAVNFAITYRDFFKNKMIGDKKLLPRIGGHFGQANKIEDPLNNGKSNVYGTHVSTAARIEPMTRPGEIFVSKAFRDAYQQSPSLTHESKIEFEELGTLELAKNHGEMEIFRLKEKSEKKQILDKLTREDLSDYIPTIPGMSDEEEKKLNRFNEQSSAEVFKLILDKTEINEYGAKFCLALANKAKSLGLYNDCLMLLEAANAADMQVSGRRVYAVQHLPEYKKIKANALTRIGKYTAAEDLMFSLWHSGYQDSDTLSMLAAQYKRRAIYGETKKEDIASIDLNTIDKSLLERACKLYVEAFRKDISEYYPAINAAYLYLIIGGKEAGKGRTLATYIINSWDTPETGNWWLATTLAEAEMLTGESEDALSKFKLATANHNPTAFALSSTLEQIELYAKLTNSQDELSDIADYLKNKIRS